jgi:hypothetical protein
VVDAIPNEVFETVDAMARVAAAYFLEVFADTMGDRYKMTVREFTPPRD